MMLMDGPLYGVMDSLTIIVLREYTFLAARLCMSHISPSIAKCFALVDREVTYSRLFFRVDPSGIGKNIKTTPSRIFKGCGHPHA